MARAEVIFLNPANQPVLSWLGVRPGVRAVCWQDRTDQGWDTAGQVLFDELGGRLPDTAKHSIGIHSLLVPQDGLVFGASHAQWSVADLEAHTAEEVRAISPAASRRGRGDR